MKKAGHEETRPTGMTPGRAAEFLEVSEDYLTLLKGQGRLEAHGTGEELRYGAKSVYRMRAEDLLRKTKAEALESCPGLVDDIERLAEVQYGRGHMDGAQEIADHVKEGLENLTATMERMKDLVTKVEDNGVLIDEMHRRAADLARNFGESSNMQDPA